MIEVNQSAWVCLWPGARFVEASGRCWVGWPATEQNGPAGGSVGVGRAGGGSKEKSSETSLYVLVQLEHLRFERATCLCPQTASPFSHFVQGTPTGVVGFELLGPARAGPPAQPLTKI